MILVTAVLCLPAVVAAQNTDTLPLVRLRTRMVVNAATATNPVQQLNKETLSSLNSVSVADAVKYLAGVVVKDYGGIGGLKTISVRSLGANHTVVLLDGIAAGDAQGGQVDLGRFSLENIESIQLYICHPEDILMPARSFSGASILSMVSPATYTGNEGVAVKIKAGSFGYVHPAVSYKAKLGSKWSHALFGEYQYANGVYPFTDYETGTVQKQRTNADIKACHAEYDLALHINDSNSIRFKTYYYQSERGLPGAVILFNGLSSQRLNNTSWFTQFSWRNTLSSKSSLLLGGKYSYDYKFYLDPAYPNNSHKLENAFHQREVYVSAAYRYSISGTLSLALASDFFYSSLHRTDTFDHNFAQPSRNNWLNNISVQYKTNRVEMAANLLQTSIQQTVAKGPVAKNYTEYTPAVSVSAQVAEKLPLRLRASYKKIFRVPTFDDLYYTNIGNTDLRPEYADLYNAGITAVFPLRKAAEEISLSTDVYYNRVKDKILASPRFNLFQWSMMNIGKADIRGIDAALHIRWKRFYKTGISTRLTYSFQRALDMSSPSSELYKKQLPYMPQHSGSVHLSFVREGISLSFNTLASAYRYGPGIQQPGNFVQGFITEDISVGYVFHSKSKTSYQLTADFNNIFNNAYEIIKFYPMPGFNWRIGAGITF